MTIHVLPNYGEDDLQIIKDHAKEIKGFLTALWLTSESSRENELFKIKDKMDDIELLLNSLETKS